MCRLKGDSPELVETKDLVKDSNSCRVFEAVRFTYGTAIEPFDINYTVYGDLTLPVAVVLGGITANRFVIDTEVGDLDSESSEETISGWWNELVGSDKGIDTNKYCVVSLDFISSLRLEAQESQNTIQTLTPSDQATILKILLSKLRIEKPITIIGSSFGGMVGLSFAEKFSSHVERLVCISASDTSTHTARALRSIQKGIFKIADSADQKHQALSLARQLSILFYRTEEVFDIHFIDPVIQQPLGIAVDYERTIYSYLSHQGEKFANRNSIQNYVGLLDSIDNHRVDARKITCSCSFIGVPNDRLVSYESMRRLAHKVKGQSGFLRLESIYGHDAFLKEFKKLSKLLKKILGESDESSTSNTSC